MPFDTVYHICHLDAAFRVFEDGRIRSSLVWDESRLKNTRTCVSWVSSNLWAYGSIYGNMRFDFDWKTLVAGSRFFWVEAMSSYRPTAYRILVSEADHSPSGLRRYDPEVGDGPLYYDRNSEIWYRNGELTGEFLIDDDLLLTNCMKVGFVNHNATCRTTGCPHRNRRGVEVGAELMARLAGHNVQKSLTLLLDPKGKYLHAEAAEAWLHLKKSLKAPHDSSANLKHDHPAARALVSAILDRYGWNRPKGRARLCALFSNTEQLRLALAARMARAFGLTSERALERVLE